MSFSVVINNKLLILKPLYCSLKTESTGKSIRKEIQKIFIYIVKGNRFKIKKVKHTHVSDKNNNTVRPQVKCTDPEFPQQLLNYMEQLMRENKVKLFF